jgi:exonuclease III
MYTNSTGEHGGTAIIVPNSMNISARKDLCVSQGIQTTAIEIPEANTIIISYYNPNPSVYMTQLTDLIVKATKVRNQEGKEVLFLGDANAHHRDWHSTRTTALGEELAQVIAENGHHIYNNEDPTRIETKDGYTPLTRLTSSSAQSLTWRHKQ